MLKSDPYATQMLKKDGCCEPISPLILCQRKRISVKKKAFIASEWALLIL